ncbi:MAG: hypothetical protein QUV05_02695 [Phycisphaerae bacterium]|nr:hypothetical protein [Phycisphaerae bacterium]
MRTSIWTVSIVALLVAAGIANAANVPAGVTGLWRFQTEADKLTATMGVDLTTSNAGNSAWFSGPWTVIEPELSDGGVVQERSWDYLTVNPSFVANGGGSYVNQYTVAVDYVQTSDGGWWEGEQYNSLFQTSWDGNENDGDLFIKGPDRANSVIGTGDTGYSTLTYGASKWHRIVWSVDNSSFFRVYVDGVLFLDAPGQGVDGRFSLYPDRFNLFADNSWEDAWGLVGTVATWNRALSSEEIAPMGGWIDGAATPTKLVIPEPATLALLLSGLPLLRRRRA